MRRIDWVRVVLDGPAPRAEVSGVCHRLPQVMPVSLSVATSLAAAGVPLIVRTTSDEVSPC